MPNLNMSGPYDFTSAKIDEKVTSKSAGNYALDREKGEGVFLVNYVGRSDIDVNAELKTRIGGKYKRFKCSYASSAKTSFEKECQNYHDFGGSEKLDNQIHPARPAGKNWECPVCTVFD